MVCGVMKVKAFFFLLAASICILPLQAQERPSLLNNDPELIYFEEIQDEKIMLKVAEDTRLFRDKKGQSVARILKAGDVVQLIAMNDRAYRVRGGTNYHGYVGWVNPHHMASKDPEFVTNLKTFYARELEVRDLIAKQEVAIGMTSDEVVRSLGEPTKTSVRVDAESQTSLWEFITYEELDHFTTYRDPLSGSFVRRFSHTTREESGKVSVAFQDDLVTSIERTETQEGAGRVKIIARPIVLRY